MFQKLAVEGNRGAHPFNDELLKRPQHAADGLLARGCPHDQLGDHRIVVGRDHVARVHVRVEPHAWPARRMKHGDLARRGAEVFERILRVDAALDRVPLDPDGLLGRQRFAHRDPQLLLDQVEARHLLGDGVLDLNAGVHLHEVEVAVGIDQKLDRAGPFVVDGLGAAHGRLAHAPPQVFVHDG